MYIIISHHRKYLKINFQQNSLHFSPKICYIFSKYVATVNKFLLKLYDSVKYLRAVSKKRHEAMRTAHIYSMRNDHFGAIYKIVKIYVAYVINTWYNYMYIS